MNRNRLLLPYTVLIPARGECEYLQDTLESIEMSTLMPFSVMIIDDGINQETIEQIKKINCKFDLNIFPNKGRGIVAALNTGLEYTKTDLIARLDADDMVTPSRFYMQCNFLEKNPNVVALGSQAQYIDAYGNLKKQSKYPVGRLNELLKRKNECLMIHPSVMYRKSAVLSVGLYRSVVFQNDVDFAEDFDLWLRLANIGEIHNLDTAQILYRQHSDQISEKYKSAQILATRYVALINSNPDGNHYAKLRLIHNKIENLNEIIRNTLMNYKGPLRLVFIFEIIAFNIPNYARILARAIRFINRIITSNQ